MSLGIHTAIEVYCPTDARINDFYHLMCYPIIDEFKWVHLHPKEGQTIIMPSQTIVYGDGYYVCMGEDQIAAGMWSMVLVCCAVNTWIAWVASASKVSNA